MAGFTAILTAAPPWWVASLTANVAIAAVEYLNRMGQYGHFGEAILRTGLLIVIAQWGLFYAWRDAPSFMFAWAFFTIGNMAVRLISAQFFVGESILDVRVVLGVLGMILCGQLIKGGMGH